MEENFLDQLKALENLSDSTHDEVMVASEVLILKGLRMLDACAETRASRGPRILSMSGRVPSFEALNCEYFLQEEN